MRTDDKTENDAPSKRDERIIDAEYNRPFVVTQYFGYLRRNPDMAGFLFWLNQASWAFHLEAFSVESTHLCGQRLRVQGPRPRPVSFGSLRKTNGKRLLRSKLRGHALRICRIANGRLVHPVGRTLLKLLQCCERLSAFSGCGVTVSELRDLTARSSRQLDRFLGLGNRFLIMSLSLINESQNRMRERKVRIQFDKGIANRNGRRTIGWFA